MRASGVGRHTSADVKEIFTSGSAGLGSHHPNAMRQSAAKKTLKLRDGSEIGSFILLSVGVSTIG